MIPEWLTELVKECRAKTSGCENLTDADDVAALAPFMPRNVPGARCFSCGSQENLYAYALGVNNVYCRACATAALKGR